MHAIIRDGYAIALAEFRIRYARTLAERHAAWRKHRGLPDHWLIRLRISHELSRRVRRVQLTQSGKPPSMWAL
ncbi:hypothetical protein SAMN05421753_11296 [Planctomicrobium piriforme]|uniref:Uncharacterized protein n=1 Tax=Planctomicrobium piriforme TaxID=1576369 RepID=A0A1I3L0C9_9PLAN|nr:hypothetical protein SAMN05421753_11296 [Planctomicrobium piriforme]